MPADGAAAMPQRTARRRRRGRARMASWTCIHAESASSCTSAESAAPKSTFVNTSALECSDALENCAATASFAAADASAGVWPRSKYGVRRYARGSRPGSSHASPGPAGEKTAPHKASRAWRTKRACGFCLASSSAMRSRTTMATTAASLLGCIRARNLDFDCAASASKPSAETMPSSTRSSRATRTSSIKVSSTDASSLPLSSCALSASRWPASRPSGSCSAKGR
mmetsp:Transcript_21727/g.73648  ORF Transcript_21727/g.73648 Transcript_21727/m.73648 type:complete len:226 (-) Transcript_21727:288-965(-)